MINYSTPKNVVIIDDDMITRKLVERYIRLSGFQGSFYFAENGEKGLAQLSVLSPENTVAVLDYKMPVLDGMGVLECMKDNGWMHKVYMLTSSPLQEHKQHALSYHNVLDYLIKPVNIVRIQEILSKNGITPESSLAC